jgi:hypothetical protein
VQPPAAADASVQAAVARAQAAEEALGGVTAELHATREKLDSTQAYVARAQGEVASLQRQVDTDSAQRPEIRAALDAAQERFTREIERQRAVAAAIEARHDADTRRVLLDVDRERGNAAKLQNDGSGRTVQGCAGNSHVDNAADAAHASYVFLLDEGGEVHAVPHALYVSLARGQASAAALAGQTLRLADWYVRLKDGEPDTVVNETYSLVRFDAQGRVDWSHSPVTPAAHPHPEVASVSEGDGWPTVAERERMRALLLEGQRPSNVPPTAEADGGTPSHCGQAPCR